MPERVKNTMLVELNTIAEAIEDIKRGRVIIVVDDEDRENEGDFICSAELVTPEIVNFMATHGRGLICAPIPEQRCEQLELDLMVRSNTSVHGTPFTVSVDLLGHGCTTGISAKDRARTIRALVDPSTRPEDLGRPGHIFPLKAKAKGVLRRAGHTEAAIDLTRLAGLRPGGALVEIMNEDGSMARLPELISIARRYKLKIITIKALIAFQLEQESLVIKGEKARLPTKYGTFTVIPFIQKSNHLEHLALIKGTWTREDPVMVRVHSSCMTGDIFCSYRCDCGSQLHEAMRMIENAGQGVILYLNQEGRVWIVPQIKAYNLQEKGGIRWKPILILVSKKMRGLQVRANLHELGLGKIRLITNNPVKRAGLEGYGITIVSNIPLNIPANEHNHFYLKTKKNKMGHLLELLEDKDFRITNGG
jgi:3,4-dihydroxy 2-butanone 4-phosphate synthase/GTP cyclohydrolase II